MTALPKKPPRKITLAPGDFFEEPSGKWLHLSGVIAPDGGWDHGSHTDTVKIPLQNPIGDKVGVCASLALCQIEIRDGTAHLRAVVDQQNSEVTNNELRLKVNVEVSAQPPQLRSMIYGLSFTAAIPR